MRDRDARTAGADEVTDMEIFEADVSVNPRSTLTLPILGYSRGYCPFGGVGLLFPFPRSITS
ncbi:MAG: hypothetical protein VXZ65_03870, partial [Candidatus Thermoplasmatota archaeon]|nr:hypothetical protein [Candidatus Thermoplasmatota archaeon]